MTAVLRDVARPLIESLVLPQDMDRYHGALLLATAVWNASRFPPRQRARELAILKRTLAPELRVPEMWALVDLLHRRACDNYPDLARLIAGVDIVLGEDGRYHTNVLSMPSEQ